MDFEAIAEEAERVIDPEAYAKVATLATLAEARFAALEVMKATVKEKEEEFRLLLERDLPLAMDAANCKEFVTAGGRKVKVEDLVRASIPKDRLEEAMEWLTAQGHEDLIKSDLKLSLGKGELDTAREILATIADIYEVNMNLTQGVHAGTLTAFCKEQLADGVDLPKALLGLYEGRVCKIK